MDYKTRENIVSWIAIVFASLLISIMIMLPIFMNTKHAERVEKEYNAWVKFTGNPKELTKEEYLILRQKGIIQESGK